MKALVAITCVAMLAAVSYFFFQEYRTSVRLTEAAEFQALKRRCLAEVDAAAKALPSSESPAFLGNCLFQGVISEEELKAARPGLQVIR